MSKKYKYEWCMSCKTDHSDKQKEEICQCGGRNFLFGDTIVLEDGKFKCSCGSEKFQQMFHMNRNPIYDTTYKCIKCGATIGKQVYYESPYL